MYLVFDMGGTKLRLAFSPDGQTLETPQIFPTPKTFAEGMQLFATAARELTRNRPLKAVAGSAAGILNADKSVVIKVPNMTGWENQPLKTELERITAAPVYLENDTVMAGLGEVHRGAGRGHDIVAYITVSTGLGGCRFVKGQPDVAALGFEPGHMIIALDGFTCNCGLAGHLEGLASGNGISRRFGQSPAEISDPHIWQDVTHHLAAGLINVTAMWSPHCIVLGGSVMHSLSLNNLRAEMQRLGSVYPRFPELQLAELGDTGGLIGALAYLRAR